MSDWPFVSATGVTAHPALVKLAAALDARFRGATVAVLVYGSCLRSGDLFDGLVDLYVICDGYRAAHGGRMAAVANRVLPPNVYHAETEHEGRTLRAKVALVSLAQFRRACGARWLQTYFWGRFAQPVALQWVRDLRTRGLLEEALLDARRTLLLRSLPLQPRTGSVRDLWATALALSYGTELRTERAGRAAQIVAWNPGFYERAAADAVGSLANCELDGGRYALAPQPRRLPRLAWALRRLQGKLLSLLRLLKALFTFDGGIDYLAWKLERHSGRPIELPDRVRRYPLLFAWSFFWRLYRRGVFR